MYFGAIGGAGALLAKCIKKAEIVCYGDLGAEAVRRLEVENLPVVVVIDSQGNNLYEDGRKQYLDDQKEEKAEQAELRKEYLAAVRGNLRAQLNNISIKEDDGSVTNLGDKYGRQKTH